MSSDIVRIINIATTTIMTGGRACGELSHTSTELINNGL
jgi:hypothetical protein